MREDARGGEAEDGEAGVRLLDVAGGGRAPRQERAEELPRVGVRMRVEGGGAPRGRRLFQRHGDGGANHRAAVPPSFDFRATDCGSSLIQQFFLEGTGVLQITFLSLCY